MSPEATSPEDTQSTVLGNEAGGAKAPVHRRRRRPYIFSRVGSTSRLSKIGAGLSDFVTSIATPRGGRKPLAGALPPETLAGTPPPATPAQSGSLTARARRAGCDDGYPAESITPRDPKRAARDQAKGIHRLNIGPFPGRMPRIAQSSSEAASLDRTSCECVSSESAVAEAAPTAAAGDGAAPPATAAEASPLVAKDWLASWCHCMAGRR